MKRMAILTTWFCIGALLIITGCGGSSGSNSSNATTAVAETPDSTFYISMYISPVTFAQASLTATSSSTYCARVSINNTDGTTLGALVTDAIVTVNGQSIPYTTFLQAYYDALSGLYGSGDSITVTIAHPRIGAMTRVLTIPTSTVPASYTINPSFSAGSVVSPPYTISADTAWTKYGAIAALLFDSAQNFHGEYYWLSISGTGSVTFTSQNLTYGGTGGILAPSVQFVAWSMDKLDLTGYGSVGTSPSRIRICAPNGAPITKNF